MRCLVHLLVSLLVACTSFTRTDTTALELQRGVRAGEVIAPGDEIRVTTSDTRVIEITVSAVTDDAIEGRETSVPINSVQELEVSRFSLGRAAGLATNAAESCGNDCGGSFLLYPVDGENVPPRCFPNDTVESWHKRNRFLSSF